MEPHREAGRGKSLAQSYESVNIGAGSAGCVVARRLVDGTDATALLLGAGGPGDEVASLSNPAAMGREPRLAAGVPRPVRRPVGGVRRRCQGPRLAGNASFLGLLRSRNGSPRRVCREKGGRLLRLSPGEASIRWRP